MAWQDSPLKMLPDKAEDAIEINTGELAKNTEAVKDLTETIGAVSSDATPGSVLSGLRVTHKGGRPRTLAPRCPCGKMTEKLAGIRGHKC
jgi:hypothetical protein